MIDSIKNIIGNTVGIVLIVLFFTHLLYVRIYLEYNINNLTDRIKQECKSGDYLSASGTAEELLVVCEKYNKFNLIRRNYWNYGNAIHYSHTALGLAAFSEKNIELASEHLLKSAEVPSTPQLSTFGPRMALARSLLENGQKEVVLKYLDRCLYFWSSGDQKVELWKQTIHDGEIPDFKKC